MFSVEVKSGEKAKIAMRMNRRSELECSKRQRRCHFGKREFVRWFSIQDEMFQKRHIGILTFDGIFLEMYLR
jgi:hypothetical protein